MDEERDEIKEEKKVEYEVTIIVRNPNYQTIYKQTLYDLNVSNIVTYLNRGY